MMVRSIELKNFRNHRATALTFGAGLNVFLGDNGQGKTNILEGISFLSFTKSFFATADGEVVQFGREGFSVDGILASDSGIEHQVRVAYDMLSGTKSVTVNHARPETLGSVIGRFPIVVLAPENSSITFGAPAERRRFLDIVLCQMGGGYFSDLQEYRRTVRQRNRLLNDARITGRRDQDSLDAWTTSLVSYGSRITARRLSFVKEYTRYVGEAYDWIAGGNECPGITLAGVHVRQESRADPASAFVEELKLREEEEFRRGTTLVGPHREDLDLSLNGVSLQKFGSQGQHKTMLVAMKLAEFRYLRDVRQEAPMLLLDDVFSELDEVRRQKIVGFLDQTGQTFITTTDEGHLQYPLDRMSSRMEFLVRNGTCEKKN